MNLSYGAKLDRIRTGLEVVKLAEQKLAADAGELLSVGDIVWVRIRGRVHRAGFLGWTADGRLDLELQPSGWNVFAQLTDLVEGPAS